MMQPQRRSTDQITVVGFDPSLRNWGIACGIYVPSENKLTITSLGLIKPVISEGKSVKTNAKDMEAGEQLAAGAWAAMDGAQAVFAEVPHGSKSSRAMVSYGVCVGVLGALRTAGIPFYPVSEAQVKKATTGNRKAEKKDTIAWAMERHPEAPWPMQTQLGVVSVVAGRAEHMADAIGAIYAGIASKPFQQALSLLKPRN
jgi:Holliday junction resolvasome RuvABC endonuclease subunit